MSIASILLIAQASFANPLPLENRWMAQATVESSSSEASSPSLPKGNIDETNRNQQWQESKTNYAPSLQSRRSLDIYSISFLST
ncbi:hypothetical protein [Dendronalium sp. ChiSLP03b]|uniref:hypothetical protein n=1 Tax=Dendronalium sp. ChiSLP03b TaxID=3075381 RepID=UPI002ADB0910|nr:hypothetical protein [Dendronalium sp. ChiSLP03b]